MATTGYARSANPRREFTRVINAFSRNRSVTVGEGKGFGSGASLGVRCEFCHVEHAFERDDKPAKRTARRMIEMTSAINAKQFGGRQVVTCYSCHRGSPDPVAIPSLLEGNPTSSYAGGLSHAPITPTTSPTADQVVQRYISALGGSHAIANIHTIRAAGTFEAHGMSFPVSLVRKSPSQIATNIQFAQGNDLTVFNGAEGWESTPGQPLRVLTSAEIDSDQIVDDLNFALDVQHIFLTLEKTGTEKIGTRTVIVLVGQRPRLPPVKMYFDIETGLLLRILHFESSPLGLNPTQIDFSDYRKIGAGKIPYQWHTAMPTGEFTIQLENVIANAPMSASLFSQPKSAEAHKTEPSVPR